MGKIINTRVSDYLSFSWSRIMNLLHVLLSWTWLPLTNSQASGSVWNSFQVGGIFFPLTFCSWDSPEQEAEERNITKYVLSPALYFISTGKEGRRWPMRAGQWECGSSTRPLLAVGKLIECHFSHTKRNYARYHRLKFVLCWRKKSGSFLQFAQLFQGNWSHFLKEALRKRAVWHNRENTGMGVGRELASVTNMPVHLTRSFHLPGLQILYL